MKTGLFFIIFSACNTLATIDYINKYFPEDSLIRKTYNAEPHGTGWFGFDSNIRAACDRLESIFAALAQRKHDDYSCLQLYQSLESEIRIIASTQDEAKIQIELDWAWELNKHLDKKIQGNYEKTPEYQQKIEREQRLLAIQKALEQKERD